MTLSMRSFRHGPFRSVGLCFLLGIWLKTHPYRGVWHDGVLYLGQALSQMKPSVFSNDIFFAYGSQDRYSIMSMLYVEAIRIVGVSGAAMALSVFGQAAFALTAYLLFRQFLKNWILWFGLLVVAIFPARYGGGFIWYGETFVTARTLAEPFCLLVLYCVWRDRLVWAAFAALAALAAHPLMALPAIAAAWLYISWERPKVWMLGCSVFLIPVLGVLEVEPFTHFFKFIDTEWKAILRDDKLVFALRWNFKDWSYLFYDLVALGWAIAYMDRRPMQRFMVTILAVGAGGILISLIGVDLLDNVFIAELQLWRTHWLLHLFAYVLTPFLLSNLYSSRNAGAHLASWLLGTGFVAISYRGGPMAVVVSMVLAWLGGRGVDLSVGLARLVKAMCALLILVIVGIGHNEYTYYDMGGVFKEDGWIRLFRILNHPVLYVLLAAFFAWRIRTGAKWSPMVLAVAVLAVGCLGVEQRSAWTRALESEKNRGHPFRKYIAETEQVYWDGPSQGALAVWLLLERPSYYSIVQGAGTIFNRDKAIEYKRRYDIFKKYLDKEILCATLQTQNLTALECSTSIEKLGAVCGELPQLGFIVIDQKFPGYPQAEWQIPNGKSEQTYYLYDCKRLRLQNEQIGDSLR